MARLDKTTQNKAAQSKERQGDTQAEIADENRLSLT